MPPRIPVVIGILAWCFLGLANARASTRVRLPMPTSETIPYVAEVMGATSYEESIEEGGGKVKRVQRKLSGPEHKEPDLDQEEQYAEYQGVIGRPGVDFPVLPSIPRTDFSCKKVKNSGYYADLETGCQVFHICDGGRKISFLCPNGTIFRQSHLICDWWFRVDCERSVEQYEESAEQLAHDQMIYKKRAEEIARAMTARPTSPEPTRPSTTISYDIHQQRRKPQPQQDADSSELERQVPAETASFASNRHRFGNQIENQYRQYFASTSTASSLPYNGNQQNYNYNTEQYQEPNNYNSFDSNKQRSYDNGQNNNYPNSNINPSTNQNKDNYQSQNSNNFNSQSNNYPATTDNSRPSNNNYYSSQNNNYPRVNNFPSSNNNNNYPSTTNSNYNLNENNYQSSTNRNYPNVNNNNYQTSTYRNIPNTNNNNNPTTSTYRYENKDYIANNNKYQTSTYRNIPNANNNNNPTTSTYRYENKDYIANNNKYQTSTYRNIPNSNSNNNPTTSTYRYENKDYIANNNNYPNKNFNTNYQNNNYNNNYHNKNYSENNSPATYNNSKTQTVTNYSITSNVNKYSQGNSNYPNRGNTNYFNSNKNVPSNSNYNTSPRSTTTLRIIETSSPDTYSSYNYTSSEKSSVYSSKNEKYSEFSKSESKFEGGRIHQEQSNEPIPVASTTVRSVTNKIASYNDHTSKYEKYSSSGIKQKPIFNVKIKPTKDTKDIAYVELLRHEDNFRNSPRVTSESPVYSSTSSKPSSQEVSQQTVAVSQSITTLPPIETTTASKNTYLPKQSATTEKEVRNVEITPVTNRYASINVSGTSEEIRPEIVTALMESGVTPTSAKALHSLASYISSGAAEADYVNIYDRNHPHVSDVILNFHSGSPVTSVYTSSEATTHSPHTSSEELPSVLTKATKESYSYLFSESKEQVDSGKGESKPSVEPVTTTEKPQTTTSPTTTPKEIKLTTNKLEGKGDIKLKDSSELRELAQVFSRALSAYLEDPETFKEILAQVRPTEPNVDNTTPSVEDEVLDFSDAMLGRLGTTISPITTIGNSEYVDENVNIGEINSLASASKTFEPDNSLELNTFPPTAPEAYQDNRLSSAAPKLLLFKANNILNNSQESEYYSKLGSAEDQSYFPTLGGVSDTSRPRYGGFQNNTGNKSKPYGSEVPKNITGAPISSTPSTTVSNESLNKEDDNSTSSEQIIPEPRDVNSLIKINVLNSDHSASEESFENYQTSPSFVEEGLFYPSEEQEKLLITSGSQSLVSSNNYVQFAQKFNEQQQQLKAKGQVEVFSKSKVSGHPSTSTGFSSQSEDLSPYFGQEPPLENLKAPSGFKSPTLTVINNVHNIKKNSTAKKLYSESDPINYHIGSINEELATPSPLFISSRDYDISYNDYNTGFGVSSEESRSSTASVSYEEPAWTVSPLFDVTSAGTSLQFNYTSNPLTHSTNQVSPKFHPTTYHPPQSKESGEITDPQWDTTYQTESNPPEETTPAYDLNSAGTTLSFDDQYKNFEKAAKEMFGMLNETAAATLMDMMAKGESNMTIRRLVLLLVNDRARENKTALESRENLINALLTNAEETPATLAPEPTTTPTTTTQTHRKKVRVSRVRVSTTTTTTTTPTPVSHEQRSGKFYRGTDSMTGIYGDASSPSDINKINAAKLYIPSPSSAPLTSKLPLDSDARAVELLKTLYSLAAKWG